MTSKNLLIKLSHTKDIKHREHLIARILKMQSEYWSNNSSKGKYTKIYVRKVIKGMPTVMLVNAIVYKKYYIVKFNLTENNFGFIGITKKDNAIHKDRLCTYTFKNAMNTMKLATAC